MSQIKVTDSIHRDHLYKGDNVSFQISENGASVYVYRDGKLVAAFNGFVALQFDP